jgi:hypothetical protein
MTRKPVRVRIAKYGGDDKYSWAVFVDGKTAVTGLSRDEAKYHQGILRKQLRTF